MALCRTGAPLPTGELLGNALDSDVQIHEFFQGNLSQVVGQPDEQADRFDADSRLADERRTPPRVAVRPENPHHELDGFLLDGFADGVFVLPGERFRENEDRHEEIVGFPVHRKTVVGGHVRNFRMA